MRVCIFLGLVHYLWDPQVWISVIFFLKLSLMALFTYLKIILLQGFQFSTINGIQTKPKREKKSIIQFVVIKATAFSLRSIIATLL